MKQAFLLFLLFCVATFTTNDVHSKTFEAKGLYSLELPDNWIEIPRDALDEYSENISNLAPENPKQTYEYGYQLKKNHAWMTHPYILVQVKKKRIPEKELSRYKKIKSGVDEAIDTFGKKLSGIISTIETGEPIYDETNKILWMSMSSYVAEVGSVDALIAIKLTNFGTINFYGYEATGNFTDSLNVFRDAVIRARLNDAVIHESKFEDKFPIIDGIAVGPILKDGIIGGLIGLLVAGIYGIIRKIKRGNS